MFSRKRRNNVVVAFLVMLLVALSAAQSRAAIDPVQFTADLDSLVLQGNDLVAQMAGVALVPLTMDSQLAGLESSAATYMDNVVALYTTVAASAGTSLSLTSEMLTSLQTLAAINASLGEGILALSGQVVTLAPTTTLSILNSSLYAMLRLADDIGVMADRILEMADKILVMADNIGIMADRILATQLIQSNNMKVVVDAVLKTQQNTLTLFSLFF